MVRRSEPGPREYDKDSKGFRPKVSAQGPYQLKSEKGQPSGYASLGADGIVPAAQLPESETSTTVAGVALSGGVLMQWVDVNSLRLSPNGRDGKARVPVVNASGTWLSVELTSALTWDKRLSGAGGMQPGTSLSASTLYEIRLVTKAGGLVPALVGTPNGETLVYPSGYTHSSEVLCAASCTVGAGNEDLLEFHQAGDYFTYGPVDPGVAHVGQTIATFLRASVTTAVNMLPWIPATATEARFWGTYVNDSATVRSCFITDGNGFKQFEFRAIRDAQSYETVAQGTFELTLFGEPATDFKYKNSPSSPAVGEGLDLNLIGFKLPQGNQAITLTGSGGSSTYTDPLTTKGDLVARSATATTRLAVGTDGQVLTADSASTPGVKWAASSGGVTSVSGTAPIVSSGGTTPAISITAATTGAAGSMSAADKTKLDGIASGATAYTDENAQDAVGTILVDSSTVDFTYNDGTPSITAAVLPAGITHSALGGLTTGDAGHTQFLRSNASDHYSSGTLEIDSGAQLVIDAGGVFGGPGLYSFSGATLFLLPTTGITGAGSGSGLDADLLDGHNSATAGGTAATVPVTDGAGKLPASFGGSASTLATLNASTKVVENPASATTTPGASAIPIADGSGKLASGWGGAASTLATLNASTKVVEDPANATATPTASKIPIADGSGKLAAGWGGNASTLATLDASTLLVQAAQIIRETGGPTSLTAGAIADGHYLKRSGSTYVGSATAPPPNGMISVATASPTAQTSVSFTGLDLGADNCYYIQFSLKNATASAAQISMYANNDTTAGNYSEQVIQANTTTVSGARNSDAVVAAFGAVSGVMVNMNIWIWKDANGNPRALGVQIRDNTTTTNILIQGKAWIHKDTTNVTRIDFTSDIASSLTGTIQIWKLVY